MTNQEKVRAATRKALFAASIQCVLDQLRNYANAHRSTYGSPIGEDYVMGDHWLAIAGSLIGLLNGETDDLNCGAIDSEIRTMALVNGFTLEQADAL
jgi:hypothetical protein